MNQDIQIFTSTVVALFLEASPFLLLGAMLSAVFEIYMPQELLEKYLPRNRFVGLLFGLCAGMLIPTCECGVVFIARRLLKKNVPVDVAMTYMLSAPVINPLVLAATYVAFRGNLRMMLARVFVVATTAFCFGLVVGETKLEHLLRDGKETSDVADHRHAEGGACYRPDPCFAVSPGGSLVCGEVSEGGAASRPIAVMRLTASEFLDMGKYLILGALVVGYFKVLMVEQLLLSFQSSVVLAVGVLMLLAVILSICSEADAFVAASFISFPAAAQISFMALGPMVDLKLIFMYGSVFRKRIVLVLIFLPTVFVFMFSLLAGSVIR